MKLPSKKLPPASVRKYTNKATESTGVTEM